MKKKVLLSALLVSSVAFCQTQIGQDIDANSNFEHSGQAIALNSDATILAVGAPLKNNPTANSGIVRIYERQNNNNWQPIKFINAAQNGELLGTTVSINGDGTIVAVGAIGNDKDGTHPDSGQVRVYKNTNGTWSQLGANIDGDNANDQLGMAISLNDSGNRIIVGAINFDFLTGTSDEGLARVFELQGGNWVQIGADLTGDAANDRFGCEVSINAVGDIIAVKGLGTTAKGYVKVYKLDGSGNWVQQGADIIGENADDQQGNETEEGNSIALNDSGSRIIIGASKNDPTNLKGNAGHARVFELQGLNWMQLGNDLDGTESGDKFGGAVSINGFGDIIAIGAILADGVNGNNPNSGAIYVYKYQNGSWTQAGNDIYAEGASDLFGTSVALNNDGKSLAVGAIRNGDGGNNAGSVRVYDYTNALTVLSITNNTFGTKFKAFPNPSNGFSTINLGKNYSNVNVLITDVTGKQISNNNYTNTNNVILNTKNLKSGIYLVAVQSETKKAIIKLLVK